jgi:hypothetical protein
MMMMMIIIIIIITVFQVCVCNDNEENVILNYPHTRYVWWWRLLMSRHFFLKINKRNEEGGPCCVSFLPFLFTCRLRIKTKRKKEYESYDSWWWRSVFADCGCMNIKCTFKLFQYRFWLYLSFSFLLDQHFNWMYTYTFQSRLWLILYMW